MAEFTANQIEEIVSIIANEFSKQATPQETVQGVARGVTQYVGARYVPLFAEPLEWDSAREYEALTIVLHEGNSYTSRQYVPAGIDISNDSFWAITGNYNAQVEAYRAEVKAYDVRIKAVEEQSAQAVADAKTANDAVATEKERAVAKETELDTAIKAEASRAQAAEEATNSEVAKNTTAIATNKQAIADEKTERMEDTETLTAQLAGTSDSGLKDLIEGEVDRAKKAEYGLEADKVFASDSFYLGNLNLYSIDKDYTNPQGACLVDNTLYACSTTGDSANDNCVVYKIDVPTATIVQRYSVAWGHCNSISYNPKDKMLYVCPCYTYTSGNKTPVNHFYKVNPATMAIVETVQMEFEPHSIYTDKVTGEQYITSETLTPSFKIELYKFDSTDNSTEYMGVVPTDLSGAFSTKSTENYGTQCVKAWNGHVYYLLGGLNTNCLVELDENCKIIGVKNFDVDVNAFYISEMEDCDFNSDGDLVCWSKGFVKSRMQMLVGVVTGTPMFGNKIANVNVNTQANTNAYRIQVDPTYGSTSILELGTSNAPFKTLENAIAAAMYVRNSLIYVNKDCTANSAYIENIGNVNIRIADGVTLTLNQGFSNGHVTIERASGSATLAIANKITVYSTLIELKNLTLTGELSVNNGVLQLSGVTGGTCSGNGNSILSKNSGTTAACSGFVVPTAS